MSRVNLAGFGGAALALHPKLLADTVGVDSRNQKPGRGDLRPWRNPLAVYTVPNGTKTIYRMGREMASDTQYWLTWSSVVHAIHGFISGDTTERTFFTGNGPPKQTNNEIGLTAAPYPSNSRLLGVPAPAQALIATANNDGVSTEFVDRFYTYTYVTEWGEESAPAPVSNMVTGKTDDTFTLANVAAPPAGAYGINRIRFYRTQGGDSGNAEFFFLRETLSTVTGTTDDKRALGEVLPTDGWAAPPASLTFLTAMWNGIAAGIEPETGGVRYCVPYKLYAWPVAQETLPPNAKAVALGVYGQRLVILTTGRPVVVTGSSPDSLDEQPLEMLQACVSPESTVGLGHGVAWASGDGLCYVGDSGPKIVTAGILTPDQWKAMNPETMVGAAYKGAYFGSYLDGGGVRRGFFIDCQAPAGMFFMDAGFEAMFFDEAQDVLYVLNGTTINKWDAGAAFMTASYRSKVFAGTARNFAAARVEADGYPVTVRFDSLEMSNDAIARVMARYPGKFTSPSTGVLRFTKVVADREPFRLPGGFTARSHQVEVLTNTAVQWLAMATSIEELAEAGT